MATTLIVERIDILEGPNLDALLQAFKQAVSRSADEGRVYVMTARFREVVFFDEDGKEINDLGRTAFAPKVVGIRYVGNDASSSTSDDFVITVKSWTTFEGHYNTHTRKGSLSALK